MREDNEPIWWRVKSAMIADFFIRWWREATGPIMWGYHLTPWEAIRRRLILWAPVAVIAFLVVGMIGMHFLVGWRAHRMASRAMDSAREGNLPMAQLQILSARNLRPADAQVNRALVFVQSRTDNPATLARWENLAATSKLTPEEIEERARLASVAGSDAQFDTAMTAYEQSGTEAGAAELRSMRALRRGNLTASVEEARIAASHGSPEKKLVLLRLLLMRYASLLGQPDPENVAAGQEIAALADDLQKTPQGETALALILGEGARRMKKAAAWASAAMDRKSLENPALLPAAQFLVSHGKMKPQQAYADLLAVYASAAPDRQAQLAHLLNRWKMQDEVLALLPVEKAVQSPAAYEERAQALVAKGQWENLQRLVEKPTKAPGSLQLYYRGLASRHLNGGVFATNLLADSLRAGAKEGRLPRMLSALDSRGESDLANSVLIELCSNPVLTDIAFRLARDRFRRTGDFANLDAAWLAAAKALPNTPSVRDFAWRADLLAGKPVKLEETAAASAEAPGDIQARFTHALNLLRSDHPTEAFAAFHDMDVFVSHLPPGDQAIAIAIFDANGLHTQSAQVRSRLKRHLLTNAEYALLGP